MFPIELFGVKTNPAKSARSLEVIFDNLSLSVLSASSVATFKKHLKTHLFWLGLSPIDTGMPNGLLMIRNCFLDFAVAHWFDCRATESGFTGDIGAIEVWLIDKNIKLKSGVQSTPETLNDVPSV